MTLFIRPFGRACATVLAAAAILAPRLVSSTTLTPLSFDELVSKAATIFEGQVVSRRSEWEIGRSGRSIITIVTLDVTRVLKGRTGLRTQLTFLGGTIGEITMSIADMPQFRIGDRDVLFVSGDTYAISPLVGFSYGRFRIVRDPASGVDQVRTHDGRPLAAVTDIGRPLVPTLQMPRPLALRDFESLVIQRAAVRAR